MHFVVDAKAEVSPISRFIYGVNQFPGVLDGMTGPWANCTFIRLGGNRLTAYNWVNNASNAGNDYHFQNDGYLVDGTRFKGLEDSPGGADVPTLEIAARHNAAAMLTVPINGYVAADKKGDGDARQSGADYLQSRFRPELPRKPGPFTLTPSPNDPIVYQDEFVNWVKTKYPHGFDDSDKPIWFSLDNEPGLWSQTHAEVHPKRVTYGELVQRTIAYADAIKDVAPTALIFGPANYGWQGYVRLQDAPDSMERDFQAFYLAQLSLAQEIHGKRLLDVLDVHWYPEATGGGVRVTENRPTDEPATATARMAAPRSLWDPNYTETSWITEKQLHGPIDLIPRLKKKIDQNYPGTKLALTEYDFGGGDYISGGIAEADVLGILGREGVFAAAWWPSSHTKFIGAAFEMYRNFDGQGGRFGDVSVQAKTDDIDSSSIYASTDSTNPNRMVVIVINKTNHSLDAAIDLKNGHAIEGAAAYQLTAVAPGRRKAQMQLLSIRRPFAVFCPAPA